MIERAGAAMHSGGEDGFAHVGLSDLFDLGPPRDKAMAGVRKAQLEALVRLVPVTIAVNLINAALIVIILYREIPHGQLFAWFGAMLALCVKRAVRARRLLHDADYAMRPPTSIRSIATAIIMLAGLWLAPALFWFDAATGNERLFICVLLIGMMSGGSVTLATVPPVAITYIMLLTLGAVALMAKLDSVAMVAMALVYGAALCGGAIYNARQFVGHMRARIELAEQSALIALLREFEASGSDWLWELDADLKLTYMSRSMAEVIGVPMRSLLGTHVHHLLDPHHNIVDLSAGMRAVFDHFDQGKAFRDIAVPTMGGHRWWTLSGKPMIDADGLCLGWRGVGSDITELRLSGSDSVRAARRDPMTGLANRLLVREHIEEAMLLQRESGVGCTLMLVDLDRFKQVNDSFGHAVGDQLLSDVARRLEAKVGDSGLVGRLGGDEFAIVWTGAREKASLADTADAIIETLSQPFEIGPASVAIGATIGIARSPDDGADQDKLTRSADLALYRAKDGGRGRHEFFAPWMQEKFQANLLLESDLRSALGDRAMSLAYQPIVDAQTGAVMGHEALLRWRHPTRGDIPPDVFIPIIEEAGLIGQIGDWVIREACAEAARWPAPMKVAVNISVAQLTGAHLAATVISALSSSGLDPARLEIEVTESIFLGDDAPTLASLASLRSLGVRLVLDDFGQGYSSFGYLSRADFAKIKIDREFVVAAAAGNRESLAIVKAILALAKGLDLDTTAEGVETAVQAEVMRDLGCTQMQGYYFGRPGPAAAVSGTERRRFRGAA